MCITLARDSSMRIKCHEIDASKSDGSKSDASKSDASKSDASKSDASKSDAGNLTKALENRGHKFCLVRHLVLYLICDRVQFLNLAASSFRRFFE